MNLSQLLYLQKGHIWPSTCIYKEKSSLQPALQMCGAQTGGRKEHNKSVFVPFHAGTCEHSGSVMDGHMDAKSLSAFISPPHLGFSFSSPRAPGCSRAWDAPCRAGILFHGVGKAGGAGAGSLIGEILCQPQAQHCQGFVQPGWELIAAIPISQEWMSLFVQVALCLFHLSIPALEQVIQLPLPVGRN